MDQSSYTTEEIARLLKVSKLTVYDLIKKGELQAYRVGRQMRIDAADLEAYKHRGKQEKDSGHLNAVKPPSAHAGLTGQFVISGQDTSLDILARTLDLEDSGMRPLRSYVGSLDSLISMYKGEADIVSTHLFDGDTGDYNVPYIRKILVSKSFIVVKFIKRMAGLYVAQSNPKNITTWADIAQKGIKLINREPGAGARVLLDEQLRIHNIDHTSIDGYDNVVYSHQDIASAVASGQADVGIGIEHAALTANIAFVPMIEESYDLVMLKTAENTPIRSHLLSILNNKDFQNKLAAIGYGVEGMGDILWEQ
ncbi:substrate-binding domain-containing protein [Lentibacillus saliphilus]|uniref:substrate-binding domain-containing protein n=1 Tax=Lentibacillus saliphilus TaxID=2737028 RepID=UPI001C3039D6|nr:substrate-binding domain-containing protein [Lentibacillus saliphilus]